MDKAQPTDEAPTGDLCRLGLVGAGRMGRIHLNALAGSGSVRIVAVADPSPDARAAVARPGIRTYASLAELLAAGPPDALLIAAPTNQHVTLVTEALAAELPVLCEKPCGLTVADAARCADAAVQAGLPLQVAYWRRFVPELVRLRAQIADGALGKILAVNCYQWDAAPPAAIFRDASGGIFIDMGVHEFDQIRWLTGQEFGTVRPISARASGSAADPDCAQLVAELDGGSTAMVSLGRWHPGGDVCRVEVFGTSGTVSCSFLQPADGDAVFRTALLTQAEDFAAAARSVPGRPVPRHRPGRAASGADAIAALTIAKIATDLLAAAESD
jgi:myo-inositol 2-dehydrogenase / D-chiro-inositol 1-dehydrogenase